MLLYIGRFISIWSLGGQMHKIRQFFVLLTFYKGIYLEQSKYGERELLCRELRLYICLYFSRV